MIADLTTLLRDAAYLAFEDGTNDYTTAPKAAKALEAQAAHIAKLEAALNKINDKDSYPNGGFGPFAEIARAALEGGSHEPT